MTAECFFFFSSFFLRANGSTRPTGLADFKDDARSRIECEKENETGQSGVTRCRPLSFLLVITGSSHSHVKLLLDLLDASFNPTVSYPKTSGRDATYGGLKCGRLPLLLFRSNVRIVWSWLDRRRTKRCRPEAPFRVHHRAACGCPGGRIRSCNTIATTNSFRVLHTQTISDDRWRSIVSQTIGSQYQFDLGKPCRKVIAVRTMEKAERFDLTNNFTVWCALLSISK